ncbi:MAG: DUF892 family protein [Chitinophagaceae bacterium]
MDKLIDLRDLLKHEIMDLYSAEGQIIEALPAMIEKAKNPTLIKLLSDHLKTTEEHLDRLKMIQELLASGDESTDKSGENKGFFSRLFGGSGSHGHVCKGMEGLITEGERVMSEDMSEEVKDAAIIATAQKIEHYEICGYGTAKAYARELNLGDVAELLEDTLKDEYKSDDLLTDLAVGRLNEKAMTADGDNNRKGMKYQEYATNGHAEEKSNNSSGVYEVSGKSKSGKSVVSKQSAGRGTAKNSKSSVSTAPVKTSPGKASSYGSAKKSTAKGVSKSTTASKTGTKGSSNSSNSARGSSSKDLKGGSSKGVSKFASKTASKSASKGASKLSAKPESKTSSSRSAPGLRKETTGKSSISKYGGVSVSKNGKASAGSTSKSKTGSVTKISGSRGGSKGGANKVTSSRGRRR